jgi:poly(hydroxyalkanoate) granule-associated protein
MEHEMVKKLQKMAEKKSAAAGGLLDSQFAGTVRDSAQQIWLAGLGAFSKAQEEGGKVFEALVKEGVSIQRKTQAVAEDKLTEVTSRMTNMAGDISSKAGQHWDKLETIFEERVAKALNKLGVPSHNDIDALVARIDELNKAVAKLGKAPAQSPAKTAPAKKAPAAKRAANSRAKPAAKRVGTRKSAAA